MTTDQCPICERPGTAMLAEFPRVPVYCNVLRETREEALRAAIADMQVRRCGECGHIFNAAFRRELMDYNARYENSLHFSPLFQNYASELAARLVHRYQLRGKQVAEIGCGKGEFLRLLCELGPNRGIGFDRSYEGPESTGHGLGIRFIQDFYSSQYSREHVDIICCRHVLEHIFDPAEFLRVLRQTLTSNSGTVLFFEVPNGNYTFEEMGIWDLIYEHYSYFTRESLARLFQRSGFEVLDSGVAFSGQFLWIEAQ